MSHSSMHKKKENLSRKKHGTIISYSYPVNGQHMLVQSALLDQSFLADRAGELLLLAALVLHVTIQRALILVAAVAMHAGKRLL